MDPINKKHVEKINLVKRWLPSQRDFCYKEMIEKLHLLTLEKRRKGDMIMLYKHVTEKGKININKYILCRQSSRGHSKKLY